MSTKESTNPLSPVRLLQGENSRLKSENQQFKEQIDSAHQFASLLKYLQTIRITIKNEAELLKHLGHILEGSMQTCRATESSLLMVDNEHNDLVFVQVRGTISATLPGTRLKIGEGIIGWVAQNGAGQMVNDPYRDPRFARRVDESFKFTTRNIIAAPIKGVRTLFGVLSALNKQDGANFSDHDLDMLSVIASATAAVMERVDFH